MDCINNVWFNRLLLIRLVWARAHSSGWRQSVLFRFVWRLFSPLAHTKFTQEDLLQELQHLSRGGRKQDARLVRVKYTACASKRLLPCNVGMMQLQQGDLCAYGDLQSVAEADFHLPTMKTFKQREQKSQLLSKSVEALKAPVKDSNRVHIMQGLTN